MNVVVFRTALFVAVALCCYSAFAEECSYTDGAWSPAAPTSADSVKMVSGNLEWKSPLPMTVKGWSQPDTYTGTVTFNTGLDTFTVDGDVDLQGGTWTHTANPSMKSTDAGWTSGRGTKQLIVAVTGDMTVGGNAAVHGDAKGFVKGQGPGCGVADYSQGSAHGSSGAGNASKTYGSLFEPNTIGSCGNMSNDSVGGGAVRLTVGGALKVDGRVSANAHDCINWGSASGGSVWISAGSLSGAGAITADGENATYDYNRRGGGGRMAIYLTGDDADFSTFTGTMTCFATRYVNNGVTNSYSVIPPGPIYLEKKADGTHCGELRLTNGPTNPSRYSFVPLPTAEAPYHFSKITVGAGTQLGIASGVAVTADAIVGSSVSRSLIYLYGGSLTVPRTFDQTNLGLFVSSTSSELNFAAGDGEAKMTMPSGSVLTCDAPLTINGSLIVRSGATVKHNSNYTLGKSGDAMVKLNLTVTGDLTVESGATITARAGGCDYKYTFGKGAPDTTGVSYGRSASHGGLANEATDDKVYGSIREPVDFGSGGYRVAYVNGSCTGGGVIKLTVGGATTMNGVITADAGNTANISVSGSGGSIWLTTGSLVGTGSICADGGAVNGGTNAGSGGRVAVTLTDMEADFSGYTGIIAATGGHTTNNSSKDYKKVGGPAGTVYLRTGAQGPEQGTLVITNGLIALSAITNCTTIGPNCTDTRVGSVQVGKNGRLHLAAGATLGVAKDVAYVSDDTFTVSDSPDGGLTPGGALSFFDATSVGRLLGEYSLANLSVTVPGKELQLDATTDGVTIRTGGSFTLTGSDGNLVKLRSTVDGTQARLMLQQGVTPSVSFADVKDSNAQGLAIAAKDSVDSGNNSANWLLTTIVPGEELLWTGEAGNSDWGDLGNWHRGRPPEPTDFIRIGCTNLVVTHWPSLPSDMSIGKLEIATGGQLLLSGRSLTVTNGCSVAGTIVANGGELLALAGNVSLASISGGTVDLELCGSGDQTVSLGNNVFGTVQFNKDSGTVSFANGVSCGKFLHSGTAPLTFAFAAGSTLSADELRLACADGDTATLTLRSSISTSPWNINVRNLALVRGVIVSDSHATGKSIYADSPSTDAGRNDEWHFGSRSVTWTGGASGSFNDATKWSDGQIPDNDTRIIFENTVSLTIAKDAVCVAREILFSGGKTTISGAGALEVASMFLVEDGATVVLDVPTTVDDYAEVMSGGTLTYTGSSSPTVTNRLFMTVGGNFTVGEGGKVTGYNCGLPYNSKWKDLPGWSEDSGSHGGIGSGGVSCYGSVFEPVGHGVGPRSSVSSCGGGVIRLVVGGTLTVNGTIDGDAGAGSYYTAPGGSVWITCGSLAGSGTISANGGRCTSNDYSRSGGGGRVAVYQTVATTFDGFSGQILSRGGRFENATPYSGNGTVYLESASDGYRRGTILLENDNGSALGAQLPAAYQGDDPKDFRHVKIIVRNNGGLKISQDLTIGDLDVPAGVGYVGLNDRTLLVWGQAHKNRRGWLGTPSISAGTGGLGKLVWRNLGMVLTIR